MFVALFAKKSYLTLKFELELGQNKRRNQKRPLLKIFHLVHISFVPSDIILLQNAVGGPFCAVNLSTSSQICYLTLPTVITLYYNIMGRQAINKKHPLSAILFITLVTKILKIVHLLQSRKIMKIHELFLRQVTTAFC